MATETSEQTKPVHFRERFQQRVKREFAEQTTSHVVQQLHRDGDTVRLWRCTHPASCIHRFYICCPPGWLIVYGDMGECMWSRTEDMIEFARQSIHSLGYFSEKASRESRVTEFAPELVEEWAAELPAEFAESGREWTETLADELEGIVAEADENGRQAFELALLRSDLYTDFEDVPTTDFYTYRYLWIVEGIKWFIGRLDAGEVQPPE